MRSLASVDLEVLLGGMDNLAQGFVGSVVGVVGAYLVATRTTRKELERDRKLTREFSGVEAARNLVAPLSETQNMIDDAKRHDYYGPSGRESTALLTRLQQTQERLEQAVREHGSLLPGTLEQRLGRLPSLLPGVLLVDFDEDGFPILIEPGGSENVAAAEEAVAQALADVQAYRRDPLAFVKAEEQRTKRQR